MRSNPWLAAPRDGTPSAARPACAGGGTPSFRAALIILVAGALSAPPGAASAQSLSASERDAALARVRSLASCVERSHRELQRILTLVRESEQQRTRARDAAVRRDAERAIEALVARAAEVQERARACASGPRLPAPPTAVIERPPPPDPSADALAQTGGTVRTVEQGAALTTHVRVVRAEQVDGEGRIDPGAIRAAVRGVASLLGRCYESYLDRGDLTARELDLVFTLRRAGPASEVSVERSGFHDPRLEACVRQAGRAIRVRSAPSGGAAMFSYRLRFGR